MAAVGDLSITGIDSTSLTVSWTAPAGSPTSYDIPYAGVSFFEIRTTSPHSNASDVAVAPMAAVAAYDDFAWASDGSRVAYRSMSSGASALFTTLPTGIGGSVQVSGSGAPGGVAVTYGSGWVWVPLVNKLLYLGSIEGSAWELYSTDSTTAANNVRISGPLHQIFRVNSFLQRP